ncbi:MAG TPA: hypothetical protein VN738_09025, partial [Acidothermaceae bacterium]|nr:hypothetical protein [Acidothermaceae bacterium]
LPPWRPRRRFSPPLVGAPASVLTVTMWTTDTSQSLARAPRVAHLVVRVAPPIVVRPGVVSQPGQEVTPA